ncbi:flagellar basal-body rod protein FlgB [Bryocella elongata]|uniref:Flagellar basal body rod protein FlgB n=1 Tax=Bryocella elongata TaxID=863522 RepID=A0A1H5TI35_9BACT|nr:flagellar basal body rod protein FlgB [Bryocella elongata]SEF62423.1 flagellar basal-body rod protein FlgB [Bryocella elongata]
MNSTPMLSQLETYLRLSDQRQQTIASNMANVDTPGYRTQDIDFQSELKRAMSDDSLGLTTASSHGPLLHEVKGLLERPDGNNVSLDRESLALSETQLQYQAGIQLIKLQFHELLGAINGGGNG